MVGLFPASKRRIRQIKEKKSINTLLETNIAGET